MSDCVAPRAPALALAVLALLFAAVGTWRVGQASTSPACAPASAARREWEWRSMPPLPGTYAAWLAASPGVPGRRG